MPREEFPLAVPRMPTHGLGRELFSLWHSPCPSAQSTSQKGSLPKLHLTSPHQADSQETTLPAAICHGNSFAPRSSAWQWALQSGWGTLRPAPRAQPLGVLTSPWGRSSSAGWVCRALGKEHKGPCPSTATCRWPRSGATLSQAMAPPHHHHPTPQDLMLQGAQWGRGAASGEQGQSLGRAAAPSTPKHPRRGTLVQAARCRCQHVDKHTRTGMRPPKYTPYIIPQPVGVRGMWLILHDMFWTFRSERLSAPADLPAMDVIWPADFTTNEHQRNTQWHCSAHQLSASFSARPRDKFAKYITRILYSSALAFFYLIRLQSAHE